MAVKWGWKKTFAAIPALLNAALIAYISYIFVFVFCPVMFIVSLMLVQTLNRKMSATHCTCSSG